MKWRDLLAPEYLLSFLDGFLIGAMPILGLTNAITDGSLHPHIWPTGPSVLAASAVGLYNGLRAIRLLRTPPPEAKGAQ